MALYTTKGDDGTTTTFGCDQRMSKSSDITEALGALDETNSFLGMCKVIVADSNLTLGTKSVRDIVHEVQSDMFTIQAELAGADKRVGEQKVKLLERIIAEVEETLPPIRSFFISGGTELASRFDFARTLARRAERRVVGVNDEGVQNVDKYTLAYLNRLSSLLYALARYVNHRYGIAEDTPDYK